MDIVEDIVEAVKHIVCKSITVGITYIVSNNGLQVIFGSVFGPEAANLLEVKLLLLGTALAITQKAIVPIIEDAIAELQKKKVTAVKDSKFVIFNF